MGFDYTTLTDQFHCMGARLSEVNVNTGSAPNFSLSEPFKGIVSRFQKYNTAFSLANFNALSNCGAGNC
jgi:hypothetical protein